MTNEGEYNRYQITNEAFLLSRAGTENASVKLTSYEHDEFGVATDDTEVVKKMVDKRFKKGEKLAKELSLYNTVKIYGDKTGDTAILFWVRPKARSWMPQNFKKAGKTRANSLDGTV